jgi:hypothetical protein
MVFVMEADVFFGVETALLNVNYGLQASKY